MTNIDTVIHEYESRQALYRKYGSEHDCQHSIGYADGLQSALVVLYQWQANIQRGKGTPA